MQPKNIANNRKKSRASYERLWKRNEGRVKAKRQFDWSYQQLRIHLAIFRLLHSSDMKLHTILEIGCGSGDLLKRISREIKGKMIIGFDYSKTAIMKAKSVNRLRENVILIVGDATKLPFRSDAFDLVITSEVLEHLAGLDKKRCIYEANRVLKTKGLFILSTPNPRSITLFLSNLLLKITHPFASVHPFKKNFSNQPIEEWIHDIHTLLSPFFGTVEIRGAVYNIPFSHLFPFCLPKILSEYIEDRNLIQKLGLYNIIKAKSA